MFTGSESLNVKIKAKVEHPKYYLHTVFMQSQTKKILEILCLNTSEIISNSHQLQTESKQILSQLWCENTTNKRFNQLSVAELINSLQTYRFGIFGGDSSFSTESFPTKLELNEC